jgi:hypothetical protein
LFSFFIESHWHEPNVIAINANIINCVFIFFLFLNFNLLKYIVNFFKNQPKRYFFCNLLIIKHINPNPLVYHL